MEVLDNFNEGVGISVLWLGRKLSLVLAYRPPRHPGSEDDNGNTGKLEKLIRELRGPSSLCGDLKLLLQWNLLDTWAPMTTMSSSLLLMVQIGATHCALCLIGLKLTMRQWKGKFGR